MTRWKYTRAFHTLTDFHKDHKAHVVVVFGLVSQRREMENCTIIQNICRDHIYSHIQKGMVFV